MASRKKTELKNEITFKDNKMTMGLPNISMKGPLFFSTIFPVLPNMRIASLHKSEAPFIALSL